jgi:hypothetical protein
MTTLIRQNAISIDDLLFFGACESVNAQIVCDDDDTEDTEDTASSNPSVPDAPRKGPPPERGMSGSSNDACRALNFNLSS